MSLEEMLRIPGDEGCAEAPTPPSPVSKTQDVCTDVQEHRVSQGQAGPGVLSTSGGAEGTEGKDGQRRYLGGTPGARRPSLAGPPVSAARPQWGRPPTGSASSRGRRRPLAGRRRGKARRGRAGCPRPARRSGTWRLSPAAGDGAGERGRGRGEREGPVRLRKPRPQGRGTATRPHRPSLCTSHLQYHLSHGSQLAFGPPSSVQPPERANGSLKLTVCGAFWLWSGSLNTMGQARVCVHCHLTGKEAEAQPLHYVLEVSLRRTGSPLHGRSQSERLKRLS